jgi:hypothetical protein
MKRWILADQSDGCHPGYRFHRIDHVLLHLRHYIAFVSSQCGIDAHQHAIPWIDP